MSRITVNLKVTIEYTGNLENVKEQLCESVNRCNCMCSSTRKGESFNYKVISSETI